MDKLSHLGSKLGGGSHAGGAQGQEDYVDRETGLDAVEQRASGGKIDTNKMRGTNEKITDGARNHFEKSTGHHVPSKISN
ncbi:uncharacterized protein ACLA_042140 [Aspergillus clavatus NRRL 1]|uniref:Uncharacterized protein n=1 Tax=Aspergillus clavatus (strain ATCC 1007 / CBS 513.65 / DSM 816 / NCTC 3887 / NRRL 1 / QM 1276 / 107) TaxID=344612 RepID=A1CLG8_ASPCL|nr:uncharacterized protein ACLA_042140 [Aspergillus clavatus NRRL 1]EAW09992.1 conserved hypothetical protein [Aspergillus clavatus NRRL 1]